MAEWSMAVVLKTTEPETVPGVRIPLSPPSPRCARDWRREPDSGPPRLARARRERARIPLSPPAYPPMRLRALAFARVSGDIAGFGGATGGVSPDAAGLPRAPSRGAGSGEWLGAFT